MVKFPNTKQSYIELNSADFLAKYNVFKLSPPTVVSKAEPKSI